MFFFVYDKQAHRAAVAQQKLMEPESSAATTSSAICSLHQPQIDKSFETISTRAFEKLLKTAYLLAVHGQPLSAFKLMVDVQKANGVALIDGYDSVSKARELVCHLASAISYKIAEMLTSSAAFSVLCDGSQARKTNNEKELILARCLKDGAPIFVMVALQNMNDFGDATADNVKAALDKAFADLGITDELYTALMIAATADGASVNFGIHNGVLSQLKRAERPWLLTVHCICHRVELAIKDSLLKVKQFSALKELLITIYYLFKRSGKLLHHFHDTATTLNVHVYHFPKVHGTRFLDYLRRGVSVLLHNWVPLIIALENSLSNQVRSTMSVKMIGLLKKLKDLRNVVSAVQLRYILESLAILSLKFQSSSILAFEVAPAVAITKSHLEELLDNDSDNDGEHILANADIHFDDGTMSVSLPKPGHLRKKTENREYVVVSCDGMEHAGQVVSTAEKLKHVIPVIIECLDKRFSSFDTELFQNMRVFNPANWSGNIKEEFASLEFLAKHYQCTLVVHSFNSSAMKREWKDLKIVIKHNFSTALSTLELWNLIFLHRRKQFSNVCLLAEIAFVVGVSNASVESCFSYLSALLSDRRLSLSHETMKNLLLIRANHKVWSDQEQQQIIDRAVETFLSTRRKKKRTASCTLVSAAKRPNCIKTRETVTECEVAVSELNTSESETEISETESINESECELEVCNSESEECDGEEGD